MPDPSAPCPVVTSIIFLEAAESADFPIRTAAVPGHLQQGR
eukprot:CAMPEP_0115387380 /NCGR_PEP_ID=MMETSP0271-20121206/8634_1 /TAXON_ID=71861 /ORGANISM="Scrippsiella trochoidea, Strain CCMP3099" /LENGTH=40 /DNA_ID= /DNA_START= /DNA_END= /DNA_ORIENTATION=